MATSYSTLLGLALPVQGELSGTWGDTVNNYITNYLDAAVAGAQTLSTDADVTLTKTTNAALNGTSSQYAILNCTGSRAALRTITAPAASKVYVVINQTTGGFGVKLVGAGPTTGVTIAAGNKALVAWNGTDFVVVSGSADALNSATTVVNVSSAAAPSTGQVLMATGPTAATWQTPVSLSAANTWTGLQTFSAGSVSTPERETAASLSTGAIDLATGNYFYKTIAGNTTFTVSNVPSSGTAQSFILELTNAGAYTITWFAGLTFVGGVAPTLTASGRDVLAFFTRDGGTTWSGFVVGKALA